MEFYRSKHSDKKYSNRNSSSNDRPSRSFRNSRDNVRQDTTVTCADCGDQCTVPFVPRSNKPVYCSDCFRENKPDDFGRDRYSRDDRGSRYSRDDRGSRYSRDDRQDESTTVTCADCGDQCTIPFVPKTDKPVYCDDCFKQNKPNSRDDRGSRYSRDDRRGESSFRRDSDRNYSKNSRTKSEKFLKKQESFYSNGSAKFNESIKRKLFEILGGKTCYSCGFKDERALSISHINGTQTSNDFGRGSGAASWGKYISAPDVAREELRVLCLNCSAIAEPISKPKNESPRSKPKRSKYFPR